MQRFQSEPAAASENILSETANDLNDVKGMKGIISPYRTKLRPVKLLQLFCLACVCVAGMTQQIIPRTGQHWLG